MAGVLTEAAPRLPQGGHVGDFPTGGGAVATDIADDGAGNGQAVHHLTGVGEWIVTLGPLDPVTKHPSPPLRLVGGAKQKVDCSSGSVSERQRSGHCTVAGSQGFAEPLEVRDNPFQSHRIE